MSDDREPLHHTGPNLVPAYPGDAGFDLRTAEYTEVKPSAYGLVPCKVRVEFPDGVWGWIVGRSSTIQRHQLLVLPGIIDTGFRGELYVAVWNLGSRTADVEAGERIGQLILMPNVTQQFRPEQVPAIDEGSARGSNGFGSSGK